MKTPKPKAYLHVGAEKPEVSHTPTPWKTYHENGSMGSGGHWGIEALNEKKTIAVMSIGDEARQNAAFIVKAVNCHEELITRLYIMATSFHHNGKHGGFFKDCDSQVCQENMEVLKKACGEVKSICGLCNKPYDSEYHMGKSCVNYSEEK